MALTSDGSRVLDSSRNALAAINADYVMTDQGEVLIYAFGVKLQAGDRMRTTGSVTLQFRAAGGTFATITNLTAVAIVTGDQSVLTNGTTVSNANKKTTQTATSTASFKEVENASTTAHAPAAQLRDATSSEAQVALSFGLAAADTTYEFRGVFVHDDGTTNVDYASSITTPPAGAATPTTGRVSWAEVQTPSVATQARVSWAELEVPIAATHGQVAVIELEVPSLATAGRVAWAEVEVPLAATRGQLSWAALELPIAPTRGTLAFIELETPTAPARGRVAFAEVEAPDVGVEITPTRGQITWAELQTPPVATHGQVAFAALEIPTAPTTARISWAALEVPSEAGNEGPGDGECYAGPGWQAAILSLLAMTHAGLQ